jgi:YbbR domain-containing protein
MLRRGLRQFRTNLGALVLALLLAFVIWLAASLQTDPFAERRFTGVPLTAVDQPENTAFLEPLAEQVVVTARARESVLSELRGSSFQATLDLSEVKPGVTVAAPIVVTCTNPDVRIEAVEPAKQAVTLAAVETVTRSVAVQLQGRVATGYEVGDLVVTPAEISIRGPEPYLSDVVSATALVNVEGIRRPMTMTVSVALSDKGGSPLSGVTAEPALVEVFVPVSSLAEYKPDVQVVPILHGDPAQGYRKGVISVKPSIVTLEGPLQVLDALPDFVETLPITITGATDSLSRQTLLAVPSDVGVVEVSYVTVTVEILPILGTRTMTGTVEMLRVPPGMMAIPDPAVVTVTLEGPGARLAAMEREDLLIVLDLRGYARGIYYVKPQVLVPEGVAIVAASPEIILVVIEPMPTPTPEPSPTFTPTPTRRP